MEYLMKLMVASLETQHPCYNETAHYKIARVHLPVALKCNISCNYCDRKITYLTDKIRPGWTSEILTPKDAVDRIESIMEFHPNLEVVGVAGPGEPLFNEETFQTLELVKNEYPKLKKCVCTNGLLLPSKIHELEQLDVGHITVTINAVTPEIGAKIYGFVGYRGKRYQGVEGSELLIKNQLEGVSTAVEIGAVVKVNTVLIPEINMNDIEKIAVSIQECGANIMNIMPLIPAGKLRNHKAANCEDLNRVRDLCEQIIPQFRKCKQCRADACGIPGLE
jgi:nitrogen fixation protein NifB